MNNDINQMNKSDALKKIFSYNEIIDKVSISEEQLNLAKEYIKKANIIGACEIGEQLLQGKYSIELLQNEELKLNEGKPVKYESAVVFVNSLISKLNEQITNANLTKAQVIFILGTELFPEVNVGDYPFIDMGFAHDSYHAVEITHKPSKMIKECLNEIGLNNVLIGDEYCNSFLTVKNGNVVTMVHGREMLPLYIDVNNTDELEGFINATGFNSKDIKQEEIKITLGSN